MKIRTVMTVTAVMLTIVLACVPAFCGPQKGDIMLSPMFGGHVFEGKMDLDQGFLSTLGLGYMFTNRCGLEAIGSFTTTDTKKTGIDTDIETFRIDALYNLVGDGSFIPYFAIGVGGINFDYDIPNVDNDIDLMVDYGLGFQYFCTERVGFRGDVRHVISFNDRYNQMIYSIGMVFLIGTREKPVETTTAPVVEETAPVVEEPTAPALPSVVVADSDNDGVPDDQDVCPDTPQGVSVNVKGCWVIPGLKFETKKWDIKPEFYDKLDEVVDVLKKNPTLKLEIRGYTDNRGDPAMNKALSENRVFSVISYLVSKGISPSRLVGKGMGEADPVASNDTPEGRAMNRRVELRPVH